MDETGYLKTKGGTGDNVGATNIEAYGRLATSKTILTVKPSPARLPAVRPRLMPNVGSTATAYKSLNYILFFETSSTGRLKFQTAYHLFATLNFILMANLYQISTFAL